MSAAVSPAAAVSHTRWVDNNTKSGGPAACNNANFNTIQDAIDASSPWDKVYVCPGDYQEQITIDVRGLEVRSIPALGARIWAPATVTDILLGLNAEVFIPARDVLFVGFWIKFNDGLVGPFLHQNLIGECEMVDAAIWAPAPHVTIKAVHIKTVGDNTLSGDCGYLFGIVLADAGPSDSGGAWGPDTSLVWRNWVKDFKEGGILVGGDRSVRVFNNNVRYVHYYDPATCNLVPVLGVNPSADFPCISPPFAVNTSPLDGIFTETAGIVDEGALVDFRANTVYSTLDTSIPEETPQLSFLAAGIVLAGATDGSKMRSNLVDNVFFGIVVTDGPFIPIPVQPKPEAPDGAAVSGNRVSESFFGFFVDASDGYYYANRAHLNIEGTVVLNGSAGNTFDHNDFRYNADLDCDDESTGGTGDLGTDNYWFSDGPNLGFDQYPDGICFPFFII
jgi:hypothetical protein